MSAGGWYLEDDVFPDCCDGPTSIPGIDCDCDCVLAVDDDTDGVPWPDDVVITQPLPPVETVRPTGGYL